jgi:two-component system, NarL family, sensor kinase
VKPSRHPNPESAAPTRELARLRTRLAVADEALRAIRNGEVDTVSALDGSKSQVFTLEGAEHSYRVLIESMNEGALTLAADKTILYANQSFARMVGCPLEQVIGSSFRRFLSFEDRASLRPLMKQAASTGSKLQAQLIAANGSRLPVQISVQEMAKVGFERVTISMVVTDMTEARRHEALLRALTHRVVQVQEAERGRVALELHDNVTQRLIAVLFHSQALAASLATGNPPAKKEAEKLRTMLGEIAAEVERISGNLRPSVLEHLGLVAALRATGTEFTERTHIPVRLAFMPLTAELSADAELALYRIFQESLRNVEKHANASHVTVSLRQSADSALLTIRDDGTGFAMGRRTTGKENANRLGLLGMLERATYVGGNLVIKSTPRTGTEIKVGIPLLPAT